MPRSDGGSNGSRNAEPTRRAAGRLLADITASLSRPEWLTVAVATVLGAVLRAVHQVDRAFVFDEIGTLDLLDQSYRSILTEWAPTQTQHYFLLLEKVMFELGGGSSLSLLAVPALAGILTVPATALLGGLLGAARAGVAASVLVALNPYLIQRSLIIRAYGLQIFLVIVLLCAFALWWKAPSISRGCVCALLAFFAILSHPNSFYVFLALALCCVWPFQKALLAESGSWSRRIRVALGPWWSIIVPMLGAAALTLVAYTPVFRSDQQPSWTQAVASDRIGAVSSHPVGISHVEHVWPSYFGSGYLGWPPAILLILGVGLAVRRRHQLQSLVAFLIVLLFVVSARGIDTLSPSDYTRWMSYTLPLLLLLITSGLTCLPGFRRTTTAVLGSVLLAACWIPLGLQSYQAKSRHPWNDARKAITEMVAPRPPLVMTLGLHARVNLGPADRPEYRLVNIQTHVDWERPDGPLADLREDDTILLVQAQADLNCAQPSTQYGEIHITQFEATSLEALRRSVFDCLSRTARTSWSAERSMEPIYDHLVRNGPRIQEMEHHLRFVLMLNAVEQMTPGAMHRPLARRERRARDLSRRYQERVPLLDESSTP